MAFSVKVTGFPIGGGDTAPTAILTVEPSWWDDKSLRADPRFARSETDGYLDYDADLSVEGMRLLHESQLPNASSGVYAEKSWRHIIHCELAVLHAALHDDPGEYSRFHVRVFEWESGLD
jgi:hypothetical protein